MTSYDAYDQALAWLAPFGPDLAWGFTNHAPMVAEALCAAGRPEAVRPWLDAYRKGLVPRPTPSRAVEPGAWREALGQPDRWADWTALFEAELASAPWQEVLARWGTRLAPGLAAAATHGVIRVGHAARALAQADSPLRRAELAAGLGYWAATWQTLPTAPESDAGAPQGALQAIASVPSITKTRPESRSIVGALAALDDCPEFAPVIHRFDVDRSAEAAVDDLTETFARVLLANARDFVTAIVFTHGVTSAASLRPIAPLLPEEARRQALRFAWQAGAALQATYGSAAPETGAVKPPAEDPEALLTAAIAGGDDHAIKLTAACLGEHARHGSPVFLAAARRGIEQLRRG